MPNPIPNPRHHHNQHQNTHSGSAEIFGTELVPGKAYAFCDAKLACFTWYGAVVETSSEEGVRMYV